MNDGTNPHDINDESGWPNDGPDNSPATAAWANANLAKMTDDELTDWALHPLTWGER